MPHQPQGVVLFDPAQWTPSASSSSDGKCIPLLSASASASVQSVPSPPPASVIIPATVPSTPTSTSRSRAITSTRLRLTAPVAPVTHAANCGLLVNYFVCGVVQGAARALVYSFLRLYLRLSDRQLQNSFSLLGFGWCFTFVFGFVSDCVPVMRRRRKPLMLLGHVILIAFELGVAVSPTVAPYAEHGVVVNPNAARERDRYVLPAMLGSFGHAMLSTATEAMIVEHAHRESEHARGRVQLLLYATRYAGEFVSMLSIALACNSDAFGGRFSFAVPVTTVVGALSVFSLVGIYATLFHIQEPPALGRRPVSSHFLAVWRFMEQRATWQITLFGVLHTICYTYKLPQQDSVYERWLSGNVLLRKLGLAGGSAMHVLAFLVLRTDRFRNTSWRRVLLTVVPASTSLSMLATYLCVVDGARRPALALVDMLAVALCNAVAWIIRLLCVVEIAEPGYEATCFTLVTAIHNLGPALATALATALDTLLDGDGSLTRQRIEQDAESVRTRLAWSYGVLFALRLVVGLALLPLLPRQKRATKQLKAQGSPSVIVPVAFAGLFAALFAATWGAVVASAL
ncbi:hypothetical protein ATCC90586_001144 [Pythium insidiosum]|nr:hypothetical protein ATCC90586_001144 [Pythium insidiosum]